MNDDLFKKKRKRTAYDVFDPNNFKTFGQLLEYTDMLCPIELDKKVEVYMVSPTVDEIWFIKPYYPEQYRNPQAAIRCWGMPQEDMWLILGWNKWLTSLRKATDVKGKRFVPVFKRNKWMRCIIEYDPKCKYYYKVRIVQQWDEEHKQEFFDEIEKLQKSSVHY